MLLVPVWFRVTIQLLCNVCFFSDPFHTDQNMNTLVVVLNKWWFSLQCNKLYLKLCVACNKNTTIMNSRQ